MLPRSRPDKRVHPDFPPEARREIDATLAAGLVRKTIYQGETIADLVARHCPGIFEIAMRHGFELRFDLPENTHKALCRGRLAYQVRRPRLH